MTSSANEALLDSWRLSLHDKRPRTTKLYLDEARRFATWLTANGRPEDAPGDLLAVGRRDVEAWLGSIRDRGLSGATIRSRWIALRNLYGWAFEEEEITSNPMDRVKVAKPPPPPIEVLNDDQLRMLFKSLAGTGFYERRDLALFRLMLATGARVSEVTALTLDDLDLQNRLVVIRDGKGGKGRLVRYDAGTAAALDRYRRARARHKYAGSTALWVGFNGPLTRKGVAQILAKRSDEAGIGHANPHRLRHTWSHRWLQAGGSEGDLQKLGGWESAEIMRRYGAARAVDRALAAYDTVNPMEGL